MSMSQPCSLLFTVPYYWSTDINSYIYTKETAWARVMALPACLCDSIDVGGPRTNTYSIHYTPEAGIV
jgi:hypothetical protein